MAKNINKIPKKPNKFIDSDQDGLSDWEEKNIYGSDPHDEDTDGDGIDDGEAVIKGMHPVTGEKFKDFFIPSKENDYKPKSLKGKRVIFHLASALAVKLVMVIFVLSYPLTAWMSPDFMAEQAKRIITLTNELRAELSLPVLKENTKLNQAANAKVQDMFLGQYFAHTSPANKNLDTFLKKVAYSFSVSGENLAMGYDDPEEVMAAWKKSPTHYANLVDEDFQEIGVSLADNIFKNEDTVFTAQYFGRPVASVAIVPVVKRAETVKPSVNINSASKMVLSVKEDKPREEKPKEDKPKEEVVAIDEPVIEDVAIVNVIPELKASPMAQVIIDQPEGRAETLVKIDAVLPLETKEAHASILNTQIPLEQTSTGQWQGQDIIYDNDASPVVPASLVTIDNNGQTNVADLETENIKPTKTSLVGQYQLLRSNPNNAMQKIFDISSIYFKIILSIAIVSLLLTIFVQVKKQRPKIIMSGLGLIIFLIILIVI